MLVLTRKSQQQIKVGDDIVITILKVRGKQVQVGIEAPRNVRVLRGEVPADEPPRDARAAREDRVAREDSVEREDVVGRPLLATTPGRRFGRLAAERACTLA